MEPIGTPTLPENPVDGDRLDTPHALAVVLRGPSESAPEEIVGPFTTVREAEEWVHLNPRVDGYCVAQVVMPPPIEKHVARSYIQEHWKRC